jgi:hypothetical protein
VGVMVGLDDKAVAMGFLICKDSNLVLNALKESGHSSHSVLAPLRARLRGLEGRVCFLGNERVDEEAKRAGSLGPDDGARRGKISFELVKGLRGACL